MKRRRDGFETAASIAKGIGAVCIAVASYFFIQFIAAFILQRAGVSLSSAAFRIVHTSVWIILALLSSLVFRKNVFEDHRILIKKTKRQLVLIPFECLMAFVLGLSLNGLVAAAIELLPVPLTWIEANQESVSSAGRGGMATVFVALYIAAPLTEELVFRGKGYRILEKNCGGAVAVIVTSLLFAVAHGNMLQGIYAFTAGLIFALIIARSGSLLTGVFAHMGFNISNALFVMLFGDLPDAAVWIGCLVMFAVSLTAVWIAGGMADDENEEEAEEEDEI